MKTLQTLLILIGAGLVSNAAALPGVTELGYALHRLGSLGATGWGAVDVDADGRLDLITSNNGPVPLVLIYGRAGTSSAPQLKQSIVFGPGEIRSLATISDGALKLVTIADSGVASLFAGWPLSKVDEFPVDHQADLARVADLDSDGQLELLIAGEGRLSCYSLATKLPLWSMTTPVVDLTTAQLDGDTALELIIAAGSSQPGLVLDGQTLAQQWSHPAGFGSYLAAGQFGLGAGFDFIGAQDWDSLAGFSAQPFAPVWWMDNFDTDAVAAGDTDGDGIDEFAVGDGQWGGVRVFEASSGQQLYDFNNLGHGMDAMGFIDFDDDQRAEIWYSESQAEFSSNYNENFSAAIMDPILMQPRLYIDSYRQGATAVALADLNRDGSLEMIVGTSAPTADIGLLRVLRASDMTETWRAPRSGPPSVPFNMTYGAVLATQTDSDPALELIAAGGGRILLIDGATFAVENTIPLGVNQLVVRSRLVDHDGSGPLDLLVLTHGYTYGAPNVQLTVYNLANGEVLWTSPFVGGDLGRAVDLDVGQLDADVGLEYLVADDAGISIFDAATGALEGQLEIANDGALIRQVARQPRIYLYRLDGEVMIYDADSLAPIGGFSLPAPLERISLLPETDQSMLAIANNRLLQLDADGVVVAESTWISGAPHRAENLAVVPQGRGWAVATGRDFAAYLHHLGDPEYLLDSGFEAQ